jgi:nucleoside-diphosphate-sugar epimerase
MDKRSIVVIGISGYAGRVLLPYLTQGTSVDRVIGVDRRSLGDVSADKVTYHQVDVREAAWGEILEGADTVPEALEVFVDAF